VHGGEEMRRRPPQVAAAAGPAPRPWLSPPPIATSDVVLARAARARPTVGALGDCTELLLQSLHISRCRNNCTPTLRVEGSGQSLCISADAGIICHHSLSAWTLVLSPIHHFLSSSGWYVTSSMTANTTPYLN
jgi:hypothetical protein